MFRSLVTDDDKDTRRQMQAVLRADGYDVSTKVWLAPAMTRRDITVRFEAPCALQVDGEAIRNVTEYHVSA